MSKRKGFTRVPNSLIEDTSISANEFRYRVWLLSHSNGFKPTVAGAARALGISRSTIFRFRSKQSNPPDDEVANCDVETLQNEATKKNSEVSSVYSLRSQTLRAQGSLYDGEHNSDPIEPHRTKHQDTEHQRIAQRDTPNTPQTPKSPLPPQNVHKPDGVVEWNGNVYEIPMSPKPKRVTDVDILEALGRKQTALFPKGREMPACAHIVTHVDPEWWRKAVDFAKSMVSSMGQRRVRMGHLLRALEDTAPDPVDEEEAEWNRRMLAEARQRARKLWGNEGM